MRSPTECPRSRHRNPDNPARASNNQEMRDERSSTLPYAPKRHVCYIWRRSSQSNRRDIVVVQATSTARHPPLLRLQVQDLRRQRDDWRILFWVPNGSHALVVLETTSSLPAPSVDRNGRQVIEAETVRISRSERDAREGLGDCEEDVGSDGRSALGTAAAFFAVYDCSDVLEGDIVCRAREDKVNAVDSDPVSVVIPDLPHD